MALPTQPNFFMTTQPFSLTATNWLTDSRQAIGNPDQAVFFALRGEHHDGHTFIGELYRKGVRQFVIERAALTPDRRAELAAYSDARFFEVDSSLQTLQQLAAKHRRQFSLPVIGITGSNGKTIVKEWLAQLLAGDYFIAKSPKSYNSQIGVPLSVHQLTERHTLGIFEAGISRPHEMLALQSIIRPTIGIFTNLGPSHDEGFRSRKQKAAEKLRLFTGVDTLIYCRDYPEVDEEVNLLLKAVNPTIQLITWSRQPGALFEVSVRDHQLYLVPAADYTLDTVGPWTFELPFEDPASVENLVHCLVTLRALGVRDCKKVGRRLARLRPVSMRLELKEGINNCVVVDDSYNNDVAGLQLALNFLNQQSPRDHNVLILSDVLQSGQDETDLYATIGRLLVDQNVSQFIGIGGDISRHSRSFPEGSQFFRSTDQFLTDFPLDQFSDSAILIKGAQPFAFERIVNRLQRKVHGTVLEINLDALTDNLNYYREKVGAQTKIMVMVKAFAYGSGSAEVAQLLQFHRVDYLAVAYADEGVSLRQNGIDLPIMVMNPAPEAFATLLDYNLEPELYSLRVLHEFGRFMGQRPTRVHLKIDTGMHRLGFTEAELPQVVQYLQAHPHLTISTVFSHLAGADEARFNTFSTEQYNRFIRGTALLEAGLGYRPIRHLLNSAGIVRFPDYKLDMVRVGIGLYGVESSQLERDQVRVVGTLKTVISQIKTVAAGDTVGYSRRGQLDHTARIATLAIGYADGYDRRLGNGVGGVLINGRLCATVGSVCMDMTMVDVSDAACEEGDEAIVFGPDLPITDLAERIGTIPYEILTGVSERVKRVFFTE